jgi:outer membrane immunogenic protein
MRYLFALYAALSMVLGSVNFARSADVSVVYVPPRPIAAPFATWAGCFLGFNGGGVASRSSLLETAPGSSSSGAIAEQSLVGGGQVGCDYQVGSWVLGAQGMLDGTGLRGASNLQFPTVVGQVNSFRESWFATTSGRLGYTVLPAVLIYLRGGGAWARDEDAGWMTGAGFEWKALPNFSIFVEYNYLKFDPKNVPFSTLPPLSANYNLNLQTILVGANFRFDLGTTATTRY